MLSTYYSQRQPYEYSRQLYESYKTALEESIASVIVKWKLIGETTQVMIKKEKTEHRDTATYQDFLSKYADTRLEEGSSVLLSKQWPMQW